MPKKIEEKSKESSIFDYLRFGESYTSLILGIVVVIVATILLLSFVHNKNVNKTNPDLQAETIAQITLVTSPTVTPSYTIAPSPTLTPEVTKVQKEKAVKKVVKAVTPTKVVKKEVVKPTVKPQAKEVVKNAKGVYTVQRGDTLWSISEKTYKSGYNWVDIARVNKLNNPGIIHAGNKLTLPKVETKKPVVVKVKTSPTSTIAPKATGTIKAVTGGSTSRMAEQKIAVNKKVDQKITGTNYKVVKGDSLWTISVRAYGDGYQWVKIAKANKLVNPDLIYAGNKLALPRGK